MRVYNLSLDPFSAHDVDVQSTVIVIRFLGGIKVL